MKTNFFTRMLAAATVILSALGLEAQGAAPTIAKATFQKVENLPIKTRIPLANNVWAGSGIIWGDYNNDDAPDLLLWGYENGREHFAKLYKNNGDGTFTDVTGEAFGGKLPQVARGAATWFSYNKDAYIDLVILGDAGGAKTRVFANKGDGTFEEVENTSLPDLTSNDNGNPNQIVGAADYDGDGYEDLLLMGNGSVFALYKNNGENGSFTEQTGIFDGGNLPSANQGTLAWGDYNGDGYPDILFNGGDGKTGIYTNSGGTSFAYTALGDPLNMGKVVWIDYDKDNDLDALITGKKDDQHVAKLYKNDGGTFTEVTGHGIPGNSKADIAVVDLNGDGYDDIVLTGEPNDISGIYYNAKNGTFDARTQVEGWPGGMSLSRVDVADYNGDGLPDIVVNASGDGNTAVYKNAGSETAPSFKKVANSVSGVISFPRNLWAGNGIIWGDYDNDTYPDLFLWGYGDNISRGQLYRNNGDATFTDVTDDVFGGVVTQVDRGAATWFNYDKDEWPDLVICGDKDGTHTKVFRNNNGVSFTEVQNTGLTDVQTGSNDYVSRTVGAADYDKDGYDDLLLMGANDGNNSNRLFLLFKNNGSGGGFTLQDKLVDGGNFPQANNGSVVWGDYNNDSYPDILLVGKTSDETRYTGIYKNNAGANFTYVPLDAVDIGSAAWIDYDKDGNLDVLVTGHDGDYRTRLYHNSGAPDYELSEVADHGIPAAARSDIAIADINADGYDDVVLVGEPEVSNVYYNNAGHGTFTPADMSWSKNQSRGRVDVADFNKDGLLDIAVAAPNDGNTALYQNTGITPGITPEDPEDPTTPEDPEDPEDPTTPEDPEDPTTPVDSGYPSFQKVDLPISGFPLTPNVWAGNGIIFGDYNNDNLPDLLHWGYENGKGAMSKLHRNNGDGTFTEVTKETLGEEPISGDRGSVAWINYDNDEWIDLVAYYDAGDKGGPRTNIYRNNAGRNFTKVELAEEKALEQLHLGDNGWSNRTIGVADYNKDGHEDVLLMGAYKEGGKVFSLHKSNGDDGGFTTQDAAFDGRYFPSVNSGSVAWGDGNGDGYPDILFNGSDGDGNRHTGIYVYNSNSDNFTLTELEIKVDKGTAVWIDYDKDGDNDVLVVGETAGDVCNADLYRNNGSLSFTRVLSHGITASARGDIVVVDLNGDGYDDVVLVGKNNASGVYLNNQSGAFTPLPDGVNLSVKNLDRSRVDVADYNGDRLLDIVVSQQDNTTLYVNVGTASDPAYKEASNPLTGRRALPLNVWAGSGLAWGDYDGDSYPDLLLWGYDNSHHFATLYRNNRDSTLIEVTADAFGGKLPQVARGSAAWFNYNNDGDLDLVIYGDGDGHNNKVFKNNGNGTFAEVAEDVTGLPKLVNFEGNTANGNDHLTKTIGVADYDGDGYDDLLLMGSPSDGSKLFALYRNNGDGTFAHANTLLNGEDFPQVNDGSVVWGDYNKDGHPDILFNGVDNLNNTYTGVYTNNDGKNFTYTALANGAIQGEVAWLDYDGDGNLDVLITGRSDNTSHTYLYRNKGETEGYNFEEVANHNLPAVSNSAIGVADIDGDGKDDVALLGNDADASDVYYSNGDGVFMKAGLGWSQRLNLGRVEIIDYNQDGRLDIMFTARDNNNTALYLNIGVTSNEGGGEGGGNTEVAPFERIAGPILAVTDPFAREIWAGSGLIWGDYNNDTHPDLLMWGYENGKAHFAKLYKNNGNGTFSDATVAAFGGKLPQVARGSAAWFEYDNDNNLDLVIYGDGDGYHNKVFRNSGNGTFEEVTEDVTKLPKLVNFHGGTADGNGHLTKTIGVADYDGDGYDDLLLMGSPEDGSKLFALYRNNGDGTFAHANTLLNGEDFPQVNAGSVAWGDYNGDGFPDLLFNGADETNMYAGVYTNNAGKSFTYTALGEIGVQQGEVAWVDYDGDGKLDALVTGLTIGEDAYTGLFHNTDNGFEEVENHGIANAKMSSVAAADLNGDDKQDVVLLGDGDVSGVYYSKGDGTFERGATVWPAAMTLGRVDIADYDGDGLEDIAVTARPSTAVYKNEGAARSPLFVENDVVARADTARVQPITNGSGIAWGDYNGDFRQDFLIWGSNNGRNLTKLYENKGDGSFAESDALPVTFPKVRRGAAAWLDYDADGRLDLLVAGLSEFGASVIQLYRNMPSRFELVSETGLPSGVESGSDEANGRFISVGDYNGDGYPDIFVQGFTGSEYICNLYRNEGGSGKFELQAGIVGDDRSFDKLKPGMHVWGDYNRDGHLDLLFTGDSGSGLGSANSNGAEGKFAGVYTNNGNGTFSAPVYFGAEHGGDGEAAWLDYDGDGYLDALVTGNGAFGKVASLLRYNPESSSFEAVSDAGLAATSASSVAVGDVDGDNATDVLIYGSSDTGYVSQVFYGSGAGSFTKSSYHLSAGYKGMASLADFDGDGKLDVSVTGDPEVGLYRNLHDSVSLPPAEPTGLNSSISEDGVVTFSWSAPSGAVLGYNLYVRDMDMAATAPPVYIAVPAGITGSTSGSLKVSLNNVPLINTTTFTVVGLDKGLYRWGVEAVSNDWKVSGFATGDFTVAGKDDPTTPTDPTQPTDPTNPGTAADKNGASSFAAYRSGSTLVVSTDVAAVAELSVVSITGAKVWAKTGSFAGTTEISGLQQGSVYLVLFRVGSSLQVRKVAL
jgi:hypothetical protein